MAAKRATDRYLKNPKREAEWQKQSSAFVYQNPWGLKFALEPSEYVDKHIFCDGIYERRFLELVKSGIWRGAVALDIGANIGNHSIFLASMFDQIHAFEPNPRVSDRLRQNVLLNGMANITVYGVGLGKSTGVIPFRQNDDGNLGASGFLRVGDTVGQLSSVINLQIEHADEFISRLHLRKIDFVKVDVEGWEPDLFEGLAQTIKMNRPIVAFEFHGQNAAFGDYDRILSALGSYITVEARFAPANVGKIEKLSWYCRSGGAPDLVRFDAPEARTYENILAFPDRQSLMHFAKKSGSREY